MAPQVKKFFIYNPATHKFQEETSSQDEQNNTSFSSQQDDRERNNNKRKGKRGRRGLNKPQSNRMKEQIPIDYPKITSEWDTLEREHVEVFNEYILNGFYNLEPQLKDNNKEIGAAVFSYNIMMRRMKQEICKRMSLNSKRVTECIDLCTIHPRHFDYFNTKNEGIRHAYKFKGNYYITFQWVGKSKMPSNINEIQCVYLDKWNACFFMGGGEIVRKTVTHLNYIRLTLNCTTFKVLFAFGFEVEA